MKIVLSLVLIIFLVTVGLWAFSDFTPRDSVKMTFIFIGVSIGVLFIANRS